MSVKPVQNTAGEDIAPTVNAAAAGAGVDAVHLLALLWAESGLNAHAERWGTVTAAAQESITAEDWDSLTHLIARAWPDISFGYSQRIVLFHDQGDRSPTTNNCLAVRQYVFNHPAEDIAAAAHRLADCFANVTCDGTPLSAMCVYNAGSDRRSDPGWLRLWGGNVASYQRALERAEAYRGEDVDKDKIKAEMDRLWHVQELLDGISAHDLAGVVRQAVIVVKQEADIP